MIECMNSWWVLWLLRQLGSVTYLGQPASTDTTSRCTRELGTADHPHPNATAAYHNIPWGLHRGGLPRVRGQERLPLAPAHHSMKVSKRCQRRRSSTIITMAVPMAIFGQVEWVWSVGLWSRQERLARRQWWLAGWLTRCLRQHEGSNAGCEGTRTVPLVCLQYFPSVYSSDRLRIMTISSKQQIPWENHWTGCKLDLPWSLKCTGDWII